MRAFRLAGSPSAYAYKYAVVNRGLLGRKRSSQGRSFTPASHRFPTLRAFRLRPHATKPSVFWGFRFWVLGFSYWKNLYIALGSASETEYLILLCFELNYLSQEEYQKLLIDIQKIKKMLITFILKIQTSFE